MNLQEIGAFGGLVFIVILILFMLFLFLYNSRKKIVYKGNPDHISLYFDNTMDSIIDEYDIMLKGSVTDWKKDASKRLNAVNKTVTRIQNRKKDIDNRLSNLRKEMDNLR